MADILVSLTCDCCDFIERVRSLGFTAERIKGLPRHLLIQGTTLAGFPLRNDPEVESMSDAMQPRRAPLQDITLDATLSAGSWALPRIIRRRAPWDVDRLLHPIETYFDSARDGTGVDIYFADTGIDLDHPEFDGRATNVYEYVSSGGAGDNNGHGTLTASAAGGQTTGVAPGSLLWSFKSAAADATNTDLSLVTALGEMLDHYNDRSATNRPAVVNLSIHPSHSATVRSAIGDLIDAGMVCVQSAGNEMVLLTSGAHPVAFTTDSIIVGGSGMADIPYYASGDGTCFGAAVHILAPGQAVYAAAATVRGVGDFEVRRGTSISAPFTAGVLACMLEGHPRLTTRSQVQAVRTKLLANGTTGKFRDGFGLTPLPDLLLYLDPAQTAPEPISGL